jgi:homoserine dehydrogenase
LWPCAVREAPDRVGDEPVERSGSCVGGGARLRFEGFAAHVLAVCPVRPWVEPSRLPHARPVGHPVTRLRIWLVGFGTVGQWLVGALDSQADRLAGRYGIGVTLVGLANARDGFIYDPDGLELPTLLANASAGRSIAEHPGVRCWPSAIEGLRATEADLLVEVTSSPSGDGEPGLAHMREALERRIAVVTSNKWPVALRGVELDALARSHGVAFSAESTVMSGTPLLRALVDGLAGAAPIALRGLLNATANFILSRMAQGMSYEDALAEAQRAGLAERDPAADVEGYDAVAKVMILSALVFGRQLRREQVACRGITHIARAEIDQAASSGARLKHVATLAFSEPDGAGDVSARVEPELVPRDDPLASIEGTTNAVVCRASPIGEVTISGPGAGPELAGQGVLSDVIAVARARTRD